MLRSMSLRFLAFIFLFVATLAGAAAQAPTAQTQIDGWNARLDQIEATLRRPNLTTNDLGTLRSSTQAIEDEAQALITTLQPQIAASEARLRTLTPDAATPPPAGSESEAVTAQRDQENQVLTGLNGIARQGDLVSTRAEQLLQTIADRRNLNFMSRLFEYGPSIISPGLWQDVIGQMPDVLARAGRLFTDWFNLVYARADVLTLLFLIAVAILAPFLFWVGRRLLDKATDRLSASQDASEGRKVFAATLIVIMNIALPAIFIVIVSAIFDSFGFLPPRVRLVSNSFLYATIAFTLTNGLGLAVLAPTRPTWRLVPLDNTVATRLYGSVVVIAILAASLPLIEGLSALTAAPPSVATAIGGCAAVATAIMILIATRTLSATADPDGPGAPAGKIWRWANTLASVGALISIFAAVAGYITFARFLVAQIIWATIVIAVYSLLARLAEILIIRAFASDRPTGRWLVASVGFTRRALGQAAVIITGVLRVLLIILAVVMIAAPWGFDSVSLAESARSLFYGVTIGSITITFSTIIGSVAVFAVGIVVTRFLQHWLENRLLPTTNLDPGLQNSIRTTLGYLGIIVAALLAGAYSGFDLANVAIVAGALSVGIGFGLQSIVNNFVSGLILLAERPIRVGDWIVVGADEGTVRRINVRSTEIETFDRATLIIPNSTLVTGNVKNLVLRDRSGRIIVPVSVGIGADPAKVKELLLDCARAHHKVLGYPEPDVFLMNFQSGQIDFELRCFLAEVSDGLRVRSDLRFAILAKFREADIDRPTALPALPDKSYLPPAET